MTNSFGSEPLPLSQKLLRSLLVFLVLTFAAAITPSAHAGSLGHANFRHGFHVDDPSPPVDAIGDRISGEMGADTVRIHVYWHHYETAPGTYNSEWLNGIVTRIKNARKASGNGNLKALINLELPTTNTGEAAWMAVPYGLKRTAEVTPAVAKGVARYYPTTKAGLEAYGAALATALKYLHEAGVADYAETANEPNLIGAPSEVVPAATIGKLGGMAVAKGYKIGLGQVSAWAPAILIGSVAWTKNGWNEDGTSYNFVTPQEYFSWVQTNVNATIDEQFVGQPGGAEIAGGLKQQWRPSFHAYPASGPAESTSCAEIIYQGKWKLQDQAGDITGVAAFATVEARLKPFLERIANNNRWWVTETGMSSFKTNKGTETPAECQTRRQQGGGAYGKEQQAAFVKKAYDTINPQITGGGLWQNLEGLIFFRADDLNEGKDAGVGFYCKFYCGTLETSFRAPKPAASTFLNYYGSPVWHMDNLGESASASDPDLSSWGPYRLDFFVKNSSNQLRHKAYTGSGWTSWKTVTPVNGGSALASGPGAVSWGSNRIDVVGKVSDGSVGHWATPDGGTNWYYDNLGEKGATSDPDISSWGYGRLDFFVRGPKNELRRMYYNGAFSSWSTITTPEGNPELASAPSAVSWGSNRVDVAARLSNGSVGHWATDDGGATWHYGNLQGNIASAPDISSRGFGALHFFGRNAAGELVTRFYAGYWSDWETIPIGTLTSGPGAASWNSERTDVAGVAPDGSIVHWAGNPG